jgi:hypothetical protein
MEKTEFEMQGDTQPCATEDEHPAHMVFTGLSAKRFQLERHKERGRGRNPTKATLSTKSRIK